jgi:4-amino-4-deoxy-L-arabinose transferase-like glycosyltransferase
MAAASQPVANAPAAPALAEPLEVVAARRWRPQVRVMPHHLALAAVLALSALLNTYRLSQNGYANIFYSAGIKSMLRSLHNFLFVSFDPSGLIMIDKPPLGLWVQAASANVFGFSPMSLLLPEAIAGVLAVALLYRILVGRFGRVAALAGALALAVFPSFVAVSRDNGVDPLLVLLMILACEAGLRAVETGRWRYLLLCAVLVGLAFNTKTLAAYLVVPGIALAYVLCAPGSIPRRGMQLLAAGALMAAVSFSWITFVDLTPASARPYVGGSTNNSELGLTFEYNGFGRVGGQAGGPGRIPIGTGGLVRLPPARAPHDHLRHAATGPAAPAAGQSATVPIGRAKNPIPFGGPPRPLRLFGVQLGDQGGWILPFALIGLVAASLVVLPGKRRSLRERASARAPQSPSERDPRVAGLLILGGWFVVEAAILSLSQGIVHPYYISALAPGAAAMAGAGLVAFIELGKRDRWDWRRLLPPAAIIATVAAQLVLLHREHYLQWFVPILVIGAMAGVVAMLASRRFASLAMTLTFGLLMVAPAAYATTTWLAPVEGTFPAAGPHQAIGTGGVGVKGTTLGRDRALLSFLSSHGATSRWVVLSDASDTAAPLILLGYNAGSLAGYSGTDPALDGPGLARLVARGEARYVVLGGVFSTRGGNRATAAVAHACKLVPPQRWGGVALAYHSLVLFDCGGRARALASA